MIHVEEVTISTSLGATVPLETKYNALIDTGTTRSCISEALYHTLMLPNVKHLFSVTVGSASGNNLQPMRFVTLSFTLGQWPYTSDFIFGKHLQRPLTLGIEFDTLHRIGTSWYNSGKFILSQNDHILIRVSGYSILNDPKVLTVRDITIISITLVLITVQIDPKTIYKGLFYDVQHSQAHIDEHPNIVLIPTLHKVDSVCIT